MDGPLEVVERKPKAEDIARKTRDKEFIEKVQAIIDETPQRPIRQIARDLGISHTTVNACVKEDLKCRSYRCQTSHIIPPHIFEVGLKVNTKVYLDVLKSVVIPWCNQVAGGRPWIWQQDPDLASEGVLRLCTFLSLALLLPRPELAGLLRLVIRQEHHQHDLPQHQSQPDRRYPPSICHAPVGACRKGMLPVPDLYRGGD